MNIVVLAIYTSLYVLANCTEGECNAGDIEILLAMGFEKKEAIIALQLAGNNIEKAAELLLTGLNTIPSQEEVMQIPPPQTCSQHTQNAYKLVVIVRTDLNMKKGKIAAQVGHAVLGCVRKAREYTIEALDIWEMICGEPIIILKVNSEDELISLSTKSIAANIPTCVIHDAGRTVVAPHTKTVCGIGPYLSNEIDKITGQLNLL